mmetsp:Transcript_11608/g.33449  ORF Transcript_11608/g.33449 Transcript_11608/m.33449 type:complete len:135 (+) Transcript_11608:259-663(+)
MNFEIMFLGQELNGFNFSIIELFAFVASTSRFESVDGRWGRPSMLVGITKQGRQIRGPFKALIVAMRFQISLFTMPNQHDRRLTTIGRHILDFLALFMLVFAVFQIDLFDFFGKFEMLDQRSIGHALRTHAMQT